VNRIFPWKELSRWVTEHALASKLETALSLRGNPELRWEKLQTMKRCPRTLRYTLLQVLHRELPADHPFNLRYNKLFTCLDDKERQSTLTPGQDNRDFAVWSQKKGN